MDSTYLAMIQQELEVESIDRGAERFRSLQDEKSILGDHSKNKVIAKWVRLVELAIQQEQKLLTKELHQPKDGRKWRSASPWKMVVYSMKADKLALIALGTMLSATSASPAAAPIQTAAIHLARAVKVQRQFDVLKMQSPDVISEMSRYVRKWDPRAVRLARTRAGFVDKRWGKATELNIGSWLMKIVVEATNLFTIKHVINNGRKEHLTLAVLPEVAEQLERSKGEMELLRPMFLPMVVRPLDYDDKGRNGGYTILKKPLVKSHEFGSQHEMLPSKQYISCINTIQSVPYVIDKGILDVMEKIQESGGARAGLPRRDRLPTPPKPTGFDPSKRKKSRWKAVAAEDMKSWMEASAKIHASNISDMSKRLALLFKLEIGRRFSKFPAIYFPWQADWRGRMYPMPTLVNPQGDDTGKALLRFKNSAPLGQTGFYWLLIHYGNLLGYDKKNSAECTRAALLQYTIEGRSWAEDPMTHTGWMNTEKYDAPFCLLAAAREIHRVCLSVGTIPSTVSAAVGFAAGIESSLPVSIDGSCNGLQHLSALGLDPIGGKATNLVPQENPSDIYMMVKAEVDMMIERDVSLILDEDPHPEPEEYAPVAWRGRVTRTTCKRGTMTTPYGVTKQGIFKQLITDGFCEGVPGKASGNAQYLKECIHEAVGRVVVSARAIMDWLQAVSVVLSDQGLPMEWETPCGCRVTQRYLETNKDRIYTVWGRLMLRESKQDRTLCVDGQFRGIAPNLVHSFDAAHLVETFWHCQTYYQITDITGTHDAYTTLAGYMDSVARRTRESFVLIYQKDWLDELFKKFQSVSKLPVPPPPARGDLDITLVRDSESFFR
jgi:DNA-directed RNA polymerase